MSWKKLEIFLEEKRSCALRVEIATKDFIAAIEKLKKLIENCDWPTPPPPPKGGQPLPLPESEAA